ncbi:HAMP domain-containing sensor histidine kinase [Arcobacter sp. F2176]|jgi:PAS domain S-box-containing protein|uniref:PAS domain-containing sensor histidine kinase n=1 Tax=Arcobacter TaxID=28196 RepID=UPI00100AD2B3|nr:HAMP domain-containing sensor histidine kinase [Arcobacter sp. F2176]RXJ82424.1 hypothetical protein CRU95_02920 [Arcobacter sp. F2176]|tara:strand:+ start:11221 stop:12333 length:1113 start_codon:yes stop_codon:yes gene_type:complete
MGKELHNELDKQLDFEEILLDSLPNPIYYKDINGDFIRCNSRFSKLCDASKENIIGKSAYDFFPISVVTRHKIIDANIMKTLKSNKDEVHFVKKSGEVRYYNLSKTVCLNQEGNVAGIICIMTDITQRITEKEFLIQQSKFAEMGEMIASIAHQWNEPLVELSAQVQRFELLHAMNKINENMMHDFVNDTMVQIKYMSNTLSDFRNFLKPSTVKKSFEIKKAIKEIFEIIGKQIFYLNINVSLEYKNVNEEIYIYGYENELKQVLLNIINNAKNKIIKIENEKVFNPLIKIKVYQNERFNIIEISDNAGPIPEEIIGQLFEPFFTTKSEGTGLGLYMAKLIVEDKMSGKISVKNDVDNVIFSIKIPIKKE